MKKINKYIPAFFLTVFIQVCLVSGFAQVTDYKNIWLHAPENIPYENSIDAPLMGNGDITLSVGYVPGRLRYYIGKNDFWRLQSQFDKLSGPRVAGFLDISADELSRPNFTAEQNISDGITICKLYKNSLQVRSWVSATDNLICIELEAGKNPLDIAIHLSAPYHHQAILQTGSDKNIFWLTRAFSEKVDIPTRVAIGMKILNRKTDRFVLEANQKVIVILAINSQFKTKDPLQSVIQTCSSISSIQLPGLLEKHEAWWKNYWAKSNLTISDTVLQKAYYQGLYTMAACSRDKKFPPGLFGWVTTDYPNWNGDYHLNYNFQAPFYGLYAANRIEQGVPQDAPLIDFMPRGAWYAQHVTHTRGILYPVGIGPLGNEPTRNANVPKWLANGNIEEGGLFWQQRSDAAYGLINMTQCWRYTYDLEYGKKIYPYLMGVVDFWEDFLKLENGRYIIDGDAIHEGSGKDMNPILSLGLFRDAFDLAMELSKELKVDQPRVGKWNEILSKLSKYPVYERNGKKIFRLSEKGLDWVAGNGLAIQHIYPSYGINLDSDPELITIAKNTIAQKNSWADGNTSNSFNAAAIRVGYDSSIVLKELHAYALRTYPNGFQVQNPHGIENACTVANALDELLCMSVGNTIRLFQGWPRTEDASFTNIRAWGAFLVSSALKNGMVTSVKINSEKGRNCTIQNPWPNQTITVYRNNKKAETVSGSRITLKTSVGEQIELKP